MADFSPTGYWALYQDSDGGAWYLPVVSFDPIAPPIVLRRVAMVGSEDGRLVAATELEGFGHFIQLTTQPLED